MQSLPKFVLGWLAGTHLQKQQPASPTQTPALFRCALKKKIARLQGRQAGYQAYYLKSSFARPATVPP
jgi:hypothetical protein